MKVAPSFYEYLQFKLKEHSTNSIVRTSVAMDLLATYHIPKKLKNTMIFEMLSPQPIKYRMNLLKQVKIPKIPSLRVINCRANDEFAIYNRISRQQMYVNQIIKEWN